MAITAKKILRKNSTKDSCSFRLFPGGSDECGTFASRGGKCDSDRHALKNAPAAYLMLPSLEKVQGKIGPALAIQPSCRILSALNSIFPLDDFLFDQTDLASLIPRVFRKWLESFMAPEVLEKFDLSLQILPDHEVDCELFDCIDEGDMVMQFGVNSFFDEFFPLGELLKQYDNAHPGLAKFVLHMLSVCPLSLGTPENIYETASYFCWMGNEDEEEIFEERLTEYRDGGENEEEARDYAREAILVDYADFEEQFPDWTFQRDRRQCNYRGRIPPELQKVKFHYDRYRRQKRTNHMFPAVCYPAVIVPLDQDSYDFSCEVINRIGNEQCQCGGNYCLSTLAWRFSPDDGKRMRKVFQEIRVVLEYFSACLEFLLNHEKEYPHA